MQAPTLQLLQITLRLPTKYLDPSRTSYHRWIRGFFDPTTAVLSALKLAKLEMNLRLGSQNEADIEFIGRLQRLDRFWEQTLLGWQGLWCGSLPARIRA